MISNYQLSSSGSNFSFSVGLFALSSFLISFLIERGSFTGILDIVSLVALLPLIPIFQKRDQIALFHAALTICKSTDMCENVLLLIFRLDEAEASFVIPTLQLTLCFHCSRQALLGGPHQSHVPAP